MARQRRSPSLSRRPGGTPCIVAQQMKGDATFESLGIPASKGSGNLHTILWIIAAVLVIAGLVALFRGAVLAGIALIVLGSSWDQVG
jgi:hypothetical protein